MGLTYAGAIARFQVVFQVTTYYGKSTTQDLYYLVVPCADEAYIVDFRLEKLYDDDFSDMNGIEEAFLQGS